MLSITLGMGRLAFDCEPIRSAGHYHFFIHIIDIAALFIDFESLLTF